MDNNITIFEPNYTLSNIINQSGEKLKADLLAMIIWLMEN